MREHGTMALVALIFVACLSSMRGYKGFFLALAVLAIFVGVAAVRTRDETGGSGFARSSATPIANRLARIARESGGFFLFYALAFGFMFVVVPFLLGWLLR